MTNKTRLAKLESMPSNPPTRSIEIWDDLLAIAYGSTCITPDQHVLLEPFKQKFESGLWVLEDDFYPMLDIVF